MPTFSFTPEVVNYLIGAWLFALGGSVGSFLNVVVYRLPMGMSLIEPGSHCPACKHPIRWFDNVPILGWLVLRGRCRDCSVKISARYPTVEALTAMLFLAVGWCECVSSGVNLPSRALALLGEIVCPLRTVGQLCGIYAYHLLLLCTLLAAALIEYDGHRLPKRLFFSAFCCGLFAPLVWPDLHPVPAGPAWQGWQVGLVDGLAGLAVGSLFGWLAGWLVSPRYRAGLLMCPACAGLFLGWQATIVLTGSSMAAHLAWPAVATRFGRTRRVSPSVWLMLATVAWILFWSQLVGILPILAWPSRVA